MSTLFHMEKCKQTSGGQAVYGLGLIGALAFYLQHASTFQDIVWGFIKSVFWPAFFVYHALTIFKI